MNRGIKSTIATLVLCFILSWLSPAEPHNCLPQADITMGVLTVGIIWIVCYAAFTPTSYKNK